MLPPITSALFTSYTEPIFEPTHGQHVQDGGDSASTTRIPLASICLSCPSNSLIAKFFSHGGCPGESSHQVFGATAALDCPCPRESCAAASPLQRQAGPRHERAGDE